MSKVCIGVKYCGGCNPRYDRAAFLEKVKQLCPEASFFPAWGNRNFDAYIVINGCPSACAEIKGMKTEKEKIIIECPDIKRAIGAVKKVVNKADR